MLFLAIFAAAPLKDRKREKQELCLGYPQIQS